MQEFRVIVESDLLDDSVESALHMELGKLKHFGVIKGFAIKKLEIKGYSE